MAQASNKSNNMNEFLEDIVGNIFGVSRKASIAGDTCVMCEGEATTFIDEVSRREFAISGMCQSCQDSVFGKEEI